LAQPKIMLMMGLGFCLIGGANTFMLPRELHKGNYAALAVLLFPLAGLGMLIAFVVVWRSQRRFKNCFFEPAQIPTPLGGSLDGVIRIGRRLQLEHELHLKISCVRRVQAGKETNEFTLWQNETIYSAQANLPDDPAGGTGIPVHFKLPDNQ